MKVNKITMLLAAASMAACNSVDEPAVDPQAPGSEASSDFTFWAAPAGTNDGSRTEVQGYTTPGDPNCHMLWSADDHIGLIYEGKLHAQFTAIQASNYYCISINTARFTNAYNNRLEIAPFTGTFDMELTSTKILGGLLGARSFRYLDPSESKAKDTYPIYIAMYYPYNNSHPNVHYSNGTTFTDRQTTLFWTYDKDKTMADLRGNLTITAKVFFNILPTVVIPNAGSILESIKDSDIKVAHGEPTKTEASTSNPKYIMTFYPLTSMLRFDLSIPEEDHDFFGNIETLTFEPADDHNRQITGDFMFNFDEWKGIREIASTGGVNTIARYQPVNGSNADINLEACNGDFEILERKVNEDGTGGDDVKKTLNLSTSNYLTLDVSGFEANKTDIQLYACIAPNVKAGDKFRIKIVCDGGTFYTLCTARIDFGCGGFYKLSLPVLSQDNIGATDKPWHQQ